MKTILVDAVNCFVIKKDGTFQIFKKMYNLLENYPNKKIILTNADNKQIIEFNLTNLPYPLFTLNHNPDKPNHDYFKKMLKRFSLSPKEVIYFEHNLEAVKSAESVGITTHYYDADKKDLIKLKVFLESKVNK